MCPGKLSADVDGDPAALTRREDVRSIPTVTEASLRQFSIGCLLDPGEHEEQGSGTLQKQPYLAEEWRQIHSPGHHQIDAIGRDGAGSPEAIEPGVYDADVVQMETRRHRLQEGTGPLLRIDEGHLRIRADTRDDDAGKPPAASEIEDGRPRRNLGSHDDRVGAVLRHDRPDVAISRETRTPVPGLQQPDERPDAIEGPIIEWEAVSGCEVG